LRCHVLVKVNRWFGTGHTVSCCTYLHFVKQSSFIHVVDVTSFILIQSQTNLRQAFYNHSHVGWSRLPKAAVGLDATVIFECLQPPINWSCSYWWTSLKPLCCGSGCGYSCGCGLLLSQREHHGSQMLQMARAENYLMTLSLLISCLN
jgi:hypothetical protein